MPIRKACITSAYCTRLRLITGSPSTKYKSTATYFRVRSAFLYVSISRCRVIAHTRHFDDLKIQRIRFSTRILGLFSTGVDWCKLEREWHMSRALKALQIGRVLTRCLNCSAANHLKRRTIKNVIGKWRDAAIYY